MSPRSWLRFFRFDNPFGRTRSMPVRRSRRRAARPLRLELLEDRTLLSGVLLPDDFGNTFAQAAPVALDASGSGTQAGSIDYFGDLDMFQFAAPVTGGMTVQLQAAPGSNLDTILTAFDGSQQQ